MRILGATKASNAKLGIGVEDINFNAISVQVLKKRICYLTLFLTGPANC